MLFVNEDLEAMFDLRRQHAYLSQINFDDPFFRFNEGSSLMEVVHAEGNLQHQPFIPFGNELCKMALHLQPGPMPGFDVNRLDLANHLISKQQTPEQTALTTSQTLAFTQGKKRSSGGQGKSSEGSPVPAVKRAKPGSVIATTIRPF